MKTFILASLLLSGSSVFAADVTLSSKDTKTIGVTDCAKNEVGVVETAPSISGEHKITAKCLPLTCVYTNETEWPGSALGTKWTIALRAKTEEKHGRFSDPQFDEHPGMKKILKSGIKTKAERDSLIRYYIAEGICQDSFYSKAVQSL